MAAVTFELPEVMDILLEQKQSGILFPAESPAFFGERELTMRKGLWQQFFEALPIFRADCELTFFGMMVSETIAWVTG